jgi:hypothetical protein
MVDGMDEGEPMVYHGAPDAIHNYLVICLSQPEREKTLWKIASWLSLVYHPTSGM